MHFSNGEMVSIFALIRRNSKWLFHFNDRAKCLSKRETVTNHDTVVVLIFDASTQCYADTEIILQNCLKFCQELAGLAAVQSDHNIKQVLFSDEDLL